MSCVKFCSIMGLYLNIYLNLFPVYVFLLLLTLSHGRPSERIRDLRSFYPYSYSKQPDAVISDSDTKSLASHPFTSGGHVTLSNQSDTRLTLFRSGPDYSSLTKDDKRRRKNTEDGFAGKSLHDENEIPETVPAVEVVSKLQLELEQAVATGSRWDSYQRGGTPSETWDWELSNKISSSSLKVATGQRMSKTDTIEERISKKNEGRLVFPLDKNLGPDQKEDREVFRRVDQEKDSRVGDKILTTSVELNLPDESNNNSDDELSEDEQQLEKFRMNILKELGFLNEEVVQKTRPGLLSNISSGFKANISRDEYLGAYAKYMSNVRQRKDKARKNKGHRSRRLNALTAVILRQDEGIDISSSDELILRAFRFNISLQPRLKDGQIRVKKAMLSLPSYCRLINEMNRNRVRNLTVPSVTLTSQEMGGSNGFKFDLTENVTSWISHADSSPFTVMTLCSRPKNWETNNATSTAWPGLNASMKVVTAELNTSVKSRRARSAPKSTLSNFKNKSGAGRDCAKTRRGKTCCRKSLKVKFSDLGISDVIIEPEEFDAHVCVGRCNAKRVAYSTTHAMFQHILHQAKGKQFAPRPCCTPTKLTELDVIHLDPSGTRLQVTVLKDAIVEECGCS